MANSKAKSRKAGETKKQRSVEDAPSLAPSDNTSSNSGVKSVCYKTQGTIASIDLVQHSFTIDPISPYVFEQKEEDSTKRFMIFVSSEDTTNAIKGARILKCKPYFKAPGKVDLGAIIALKNGHEKVELEVELQDGFGVEKDKIQITALRTVK